MPANHVSGLIFSWGMGACHLTGVALSGSHCCCWSVHIEYCILTALRHLTARLQTHSDIPKPTAPFTIPPLNIHPQPPKPQIPRNSRLTFPNHNTQLHPILCTTCTPTGFVGCHQPPGSGPPDPGHGCPCGLATSEWPASGAGPADVPGLAPGRWLPATQPGSDPGGWW